MAQLVGHGECEPEPVVFDTENAKVVRVGSTTAAGWKLIAESLERRSRCVRLHGRAPTGAAASISSSPLTASGDLANLAGLAATARL
jgi:hypothetical protein